MRARVRQTSPNEYRAFFVGRFAKVIPFAYPAKLNRIPGTNQYYSSQRLPLLGVYRMNATITSHQFNARYQSKRDQGTFRFSR